MIGDFRISIFSFVAPRGTSATNVATCGTLSLSLWLLMLLCSGCAPLMNWKKPWSAGEEKPKDQADRILAIWSDTILHQANEPGIRGFGGRVFFYRDGETDPIEVDGGVAIYAFDALTMDSSGAAPEKKFVFTADQLKSHFSECSLGPSYSFWLPWDKVGGPPRQISLVTRFESSAGGAVISQPARKLLPGVEPPKATTVTKSTRSTVEPASYSAADSDEPTQSDNTKSQSTDELTITLPPSIAQRLSDRQAAHEAALKQHQSQISAGLAPPAIAAPATLPTPANGSELGPPQAPAPSTSPPNPAAHRLQPLHPKPRSLGAR